MSQFIPWHTAVLHMKHTAPPATHFNPSQDLVLQNVAKVVDAKTPALSYYPLILGTTSPDHPCPLW